MRALLAAAALLIPVAGFGQVLTGQTAGVYFVMQDLTPTAGTNGRAFGINNSLQIAGFVFPSDLQLGYLTQAALFTRTSINSALGTLPGFPNSTAFGLNDGGQVVGYVGNGTAHSDGVTHAALFSGGKATDLGLLPQGTNSVAVAINAAGQAVGYADTVTANGGVTHAALFANGTVTDLGALPNSPYSAATALNDSGVAVGYNIDVTNIEHAVMFANGTVTDLGVLPGDVTSIANGIDDSGVAIGTSVSAGGQAHAVSFANGQVTLLVTNAVSGGASTGAQASDGFGDTVGTVASGGYSHAALFAGDQVIDLGTLPGLPASGAQSINQSFQIAGWALDPSTGVYHAVIWLQATLADFATLFVTDQQYFMLDDEQTGNAALNHLHITTLDQATGNFTGSIWAPTLLPGLVPAVTLSVTGKISIGQNLARVGNFYSISFTWTYQGSACQPGAPVPAAAETATYTGGITFLGYQGSGQMHATIGGTIAGNYADCALGNIALGPLPFSGQLTK